MSRSGYSDGLSQGELACWRGAVASAMRGRRGQAFLRDMLAALDSLPAKRLIPSALVARDGECCAMGAVALKRGLDLSGVDATEPEHVSDAFGIARAMAQEIAYENDECGPARETPEQRWSRMRAWVEGEISSAMVPGLPSEPGKVNP
jgi:hypothetical protein